MTVKKRKTLFKLNLNNYFYCLHYLTIDVQSELLQRHHDLYIIQLKAHIHLHSTYNNLLHILLGILLCFPWNPWMCNICHNRKKCIGSANKSIIYLPRSQRSKDENYKDMGKQKGGKQSLFAYNGKRVAMQEKIITCLVWWGENPNCGICFYYLFF